jgi:S-adenosylmethionine:tRNA ribosyltransferase-isomerase
MTTSDFDYELPPELIAQEPPPERTLARMMVLGRETGSICHGGVVDFPERLRRGDVLVVNDTRVIQARVFGVRADTGGRVEVLFIEEASPGVWDACYRASGPPRAGQRMTLAGGAIEARIAGVAGGGRVSLEVSAARPLPEILDQAGFAPLPPYIRRRRGGSPSAADRERYQTVYARHPGAVAAPTAGLHMTEDLLRRIESRGVSIVALTLHVGPGTFTPVKVEDPTRHVMESERYTIPAATAAAVERARAGGGRVVALGSTTVRALESAFGDGGGEGANGSPVAEPVRVPPGVARPAVRREERRNSYEFRYGIGSEGLPRSGTREGSADEGERTGGTGRGGILTNSATGGEDSGAPGFPALRGRTSLFILEPYRFRVVDAMLTNFHLPRSTLLMMVCAFAGHDRVMSAYREAVAGKYRFYSYGDCMLIA